MLCFWWFLGLLFGLFAIVFIVIVDLGVASLGAASLPVAAPIDAALVFVMCTVGYTIGRGMLLPSSSQR